MKLTLGSVVGIAGVLFARAISGSTPAPIEGTRGALLLEESFEAATLPIGWSRNTGKLGVAGGRLHASQLASDHHIGAFRKQLPLKNCVIQLDFNFSGATMFHLGFDPAAGELKKQGHLFALVITPESWTITEQPDKADPKSQAVVHAKAAAKFTPGEWFTLTLEVNGETVVARVAGKPTLRATAKDFKVKKPGLVFRVGGTDGREILLDNLKVWALE